MNAPKHPEITVPLIGEDGNAYAILGRVQSAMEEAGLSAEEVSNYLAEATSGDYVHLLRTTMEWVSVPTD